MGKNTTTSRTGQSTAARSFATKAVIAGCVVSLAAVASMASAQTSASTAAPAAAGAAGTTAGVGGLSVGTLAAIGAGVVAVAAVAATASSSSSGNGSGGQTSSTGMTSTTGTTSNTSTTSSTSTTSTTTGATGAGAAGGVSSSTQSGTPSGTPSSAQTTPDNKSQFEALVSKGVLTPDSKGGFNLVTSPRPSASDMATLIALTWNATQVAGVSQTQLIGALSKEQVIDQFSPGYDPAASLNLAQLQTQLAQDLKLNKTGSGTADDWSKNLVDQIIQTVQNTIADDVQRQKIVDAAAGGSSAFPYIAAGFVTPESSFPTNLTATFNGTVAGALTNGMAVGGTLSMTVNFANLSSIPGSINFSNGGTGTFNLLESSGFIGGTLGGTFAGQAITAGIVSGQFYGPAANEAGGTWNLTAGANVGNGQFSAKR